MFKKIVSVLLAAVMFILIVPMPAVLAAPVTADFEGLGYSDAYHIEESVPVQGFKFSTSAGQGMEYRSTWGESKSAGLISYFIPGGIAWVEFKRNDGVDFALRSIYYN